MRAEKKIMFIAYYFRKQESAISFRNVSIKKSLKSASAEAGANTQTPLEPRCMTQLYESVRGTFVGSGINW